MGERFLAFVRDYAPLFRLRTRSVLSQAQDYLSGLFQAARRNVERMAEVVVGTNAQALHHFLSKSPWQWRPVMDQVARDADALIGGDADSCLVLDETCFAKKGKKSVGVARQWFGLQGKIENCQVAVCAALVRGCLVCLIDTELYLPKEWTQDRLRCEAAGVPQQRQELKTKPQLALEIVQRAQENGVRFSWVAGDGTYGKDRVLRRALDDAGVTFVLDVHCDQRIYLVDPGTEDSPQSVRVDVWANSQPQTAWQQVCLRHSTQGPLQVEALHVRVWVLEGQESEARCWHLILTREVGGNTIKYSLSNASAETSLERLAYMQRQRYWVERIFQDAKNEAGMDEYQARSWMAWYHHMALVMMAMLFVLRERLSQSNELPLLSARDVKILLARVLPRRDSDLEEVIRQLKVRHRQRQASIESAQRRQRTPTRPSEANVTK